LSHEEGQWLKQYDELRNILTELSEGDLAFLDTAVLHHRLPEFGALVVHAGIVPDMTTLPRLDKLGKLSKEELRIIGRVMHVRYVRSLPGISYTLEITLPKTPETLAADEIAAGRARAQAILALSSGKNASIVLRNRSDVPVGAFVEPDTEVPGDRFWANVYDGRFGHVYFGHSPFLQDGPKKFPFATGLDLGACCGGKLCAAVLESGKEPRFVTVNSSKKFSEHTSWEKRVPVDEEITSNNVIPTSIGNL
jgi:hypothetical protein